MINNTIGASSIITTVGLKISDEAEVIELSNSWLMADWGMPDWALMISMIGGIFFIINLALNSYIACKTIKNLKRKNKDKK